MTDDCQFQTTTPKGALSQSARGGATRYRRCKNRARHTIEIPHSSLRHSGTREVRCCGLHKRLFEEKGYLP